MTNPVEPRIRLTLELTEGQEWFLAFAVQMAATTAWEASVANDLSPQPHPEGCTCDTGWSEDLASAEAIMAQLPGGVLRRWREGLSDAGVNDNGEEEDD